jgi:2-polyprenyl-6-methoxyphenol hydroxylase-like FAD-dependent oxidoreductase
MRVAIIGAGLGGLCLAQGLRDSGVAVSVHERDADMASRRQGYRIHIGPGGAAALGQCLPPALYELFVASSGQSAHKITVMNPRLRTLKEFPTNEPHVGMSVPADRRTLRQVLLAGLDDVVRFGHDFKRYELRGDRVHAYFSDGSKVEVDVLVGADGIGSVVRRQLLPDAEPVSTGTEIIYGKTLLDDATCALVPAALCEGFVAVTASPRPMGMALGLLELTERPPVAAARLQPGLRVDDCSDYLMWALSGPSRSFPAALHEFDSKALRDVALGVIRRWHPHLRDLVGRCELHQTFALTVHESPVIRPWLPSRVTVLGDAVHAMSPAGGSGANVALQDAALLRRVLTEGDPNDPIPSIAQYETSMIDNGFAAIRASRQANQRITP